jgi:CBS domain-containing protein
MNAGDVMTRPAATLRDDASLGDAIGLMQDRAVSGLPVLDRYGRLVGMLTEGDLLRRVEVGTGAHHRSGWWDFLRAAGADAREYVRTHSRTVGDLMTRTPVSVTEGTSLEDVVELMEKKRIKRLPVIRDDEVVGVVSRSDLLRAVGASLSALTADDGGDTAMLGRLRTELDQQPWFPARDVSLSVTAGVVALGGTVTDERMHAAIRVAARNISGRTEIEDGITVVDPTLGLSTTGL